MISEAAEIVKYFIKDLPWIDKIGGLTKVYNRTIDGKTTKYPIGFNASEDDCKKGVYTEFIPDTTKKSIVYFEGNRARFTRQSERLSVTVPLKLICWINLKKIGREKLYSHLAITEISKAIPFKLFNYDDFQRCKITILDEDKENVFSRFNYDQRLTLYPYDYFALNIEVSFEVNHNCLEIPILDDLISC